MTTTPTPPTLAQAKVHFRSYTRGILTDHALDASKRGVVWSVDANGVPRVRFEEYSFRFTQSPYGHIETWQENLG